MIGAGDVLLDSSLDSITTDHAARQRASTSHDAHAELRLDPPVPVPDHVAVEHADEPVHRDAREAALAEELLLDHSPRLRSARI